MKTTTSIKALFVLLAIVALLCSSERAAAQVESNRIQSLAQQADAIVVGKVSTVRSEWTADKTRIVTKVSVDVDEYVKGQSTGKTLVITHMGGEVDGVGELYTSAPHFSAGEDVLVFVKKDSKNNLNVAGGTEGKVRIMKNESTGERMVGGNISLNKFTDMVKTAVKQQKTD
jgi:hypothetical protein